MSRFLRGAVVVVLTVSGATVVFRKLGWNVPGFK